MRFLIMRQLLGPHFLRKLGDAEDIVKKTPIYLLHTLAVLEICDVMILRKQFPFQSTSSSPFDQM